MAVIETNDVFQINDIFFTVGASAIEVQQENLAYKFHMLRHTSSTKIPTGHGGCIVNVSIQVPREDVLKLHRLIVQSKRNPFLFIENKLLRHKIVPHWSSEQNMAFSLLNLHVESIVGNVGLYNLQLQLQWFNYFPLTHNFLFRQEWETDWMKVDRSSEDLDKLLNYIDAPNARYIRQSIFGFITQTWSEKMHPPNGFAQTFEEHMKDWNGFILDLLPVPSGMRKAFPVKNPRDSKIYVRYYNELQSRALRDNFYIDLKDPAYLDAKEYYAGLLSGDGKGSGAPTLPEYLAFKGLAAGIIEKMLAFDYFNLGFKIYRYVDLPPSFKNALNANTNEVVADKIGHDEVIANNPQSEIDIPEEVRTHVLEWENLMDCNPTFRAVAVQVLQRMINGQNLSGTEYKNGMLRVLQTIRPLNDAKGSSTSLHKIRTPDGKPDAFAMDLNLVDTGLVGNHLDKIDSFQGILENDLSHAIAVQKFHFDYGYVVNSAFKGLLVWGGNFNNGYDSESIQKTPIRVGNAVALLPFTLGEIVANRTVKNLGAPPSNYLDIIYPSGTPGTDHVHIQYYFAWNSAYTYEKLQSGWRPSTANGVPVYNQDLGTFVDGNGETKPWYTVFDTLGSKALLDADKTFFIQIKQLTAAGWKYYQRDPSVNGIFEKDIEVTVPSSSGNIRLGPEGFQGFADGSDLDLDTILHKVSGTLRHIVVALPILGHEFPVHQHLGSIDAQYNFEFLTGDRIGRRDGLGKRAQLLEAARITLQQNGRALRTIYDSWMADADNFITRLFGTYHWAAAYPSRDPAFEKANKELVKNAKKTIISASQTATVPGSPGLSSFMLQLEETQPHVAEELVKTTQVSSSDYENIYRKIIQKILKISKRGNAPYSAEVIQNMTRDVGQDIGNLIAGFTTPESQANVANSINQGVDFRTSGTLEVAESVQRYFNESTASDLMTKAASMKLTYLSLDESKTQGLTQEEIEQIDGLIKSVSIATVLGELILFEDTYGGLSDPQDLYGAETLINPKAKSFLDFSYSHWGPFSKGVVSFLLGFLTEGVAITSAAALPIVTASGISYTTTNFATGSDTLATLSAIGGGMAAVPATIVSSFAGAIGGIGFTASEGGTILRNTALQEIITINYLREIAELSGGLELMFVSATSDYLAGITNSFFSFDQSPLSKNEQVYGIASSARNYLQARFNNQTVGKITIEEFEKEKVSLIKTTIAQTLRGMFNNPALLKFFEIEEDVAKLYQKTVTDERDALPDLNLPEHPYWGKSYLTGPDFYYYNFHEDGQYSSGEYLQRLYTEPLKEYVEGTYSFMKQMKEGGISLSALSGDITAGEIHGSYDGDDLPADDELLKEMDSEKGLSSKLKTMGYTSPNAQTGKPDTLTFNQGKNSCNFLASNFDHDSIYTPQTTSALIDKLKSVEAHFGKKEGFANEREEIAKIIPGKTTALSDENRSPDSFTHFFGKEDLESIAHESLKDLISQKFTMKRAWPTFRLYMIEEDQTEDFLIRYDDFYNYNAIKEITVIRSREVSGDMAIIVMQNISGILDGSKRLALKDTDFLLDNRTVTGDLTSKGRKIEESRKPENMDTAKEETATSIVLRPGINVQLRMGYGNDPNNLEVKLSGRVVDVMFSENSDIVEVTVQSFGVELEQQQKGLMPDNGEVYDLTHKLLGSLMFSPELIHFGRFERGTQFQFGEAKDSNLDFRNYSSDPWWNKITGIYFANTANQISDLWESYTDILSPIRDIKIAINKLEFGAALTWDTALAVPRAAWQIGITSAAKLLSNEIKERVGYALSSPQDDNLFPPNPKDYLLRPNWIWAITKNAVYDTWWKKPGFNLDALATAGIRAAQNALQVWVSPKLKLEELTFTPQGQTIFQIFHEMTLRHPGYVYAPMPYGKEFRYTMFFGVPSQRYWSKPAHPAMIARTNMLRKALASPMNDNSTLSSDKPDIFDIKRVHTVSELRTFLKQAMSSEESYYATIGQEILKRSKNRNGDTAALDSLGINSLQEALLQYYQALILRFEPFRRYHMTTSESDIMMNNISASEYDVANAVAVKYYNPGSEEDREQEDIALVKMHDAIPDSEIRLKQIDHRNVNGPNLALRYGVGELIYQAKQMYQGSLLLYGNSRIKPWDIVYIMDKYNDMAGPVEVEQVIEKFSFESGYITEIKPNAVAFANEISSFPIMEGLKAVVGAVSAEQDKFYTTFRGNDFFNFLTTNSITSGTIESIDDIIFRGDLLEGRKIRDISEYAQGEMALRMGLPSITQFNGEGEGLSHNLSMTASQTVFTSGAWLLGGMLYVMKCAQGQSIIIYPLIKNGIPLVAGIPAARPETLWSIFRGQVRAFAEDVAKGTIDYLSYWKLLGMDSIKTFTIDSKRNKSTAEASNMATG